MDFSIIDVVKGQLDNEMWGHLGGLLGQESSKLSAGISSTVPSLLNGISQRASLPGGAESLFDTLNKHDTPSVSSIKSMLSDCLLYTSPSPRDRG